jgi:hypothetical protein
MLRKSFVLRLFTFFFLLGVIAACDLNEVEKEPVTASAKPTSPMPSLSPTSCTGWTCEITGVVTTGGAVPSDVFASQVVKLHQISWCSPTAGDQEAQIGTDGTFSFEVYLHDTDSFNISVDIPGYQPEKIKFGGFDCLYCSCPPIELSVSQE